MLLINVTNLYLVGQGYIFTKFLIQFLRWLCLCQLGMRASLPTEPVYATQNWQSFSPVYLLVRSLPSFAQFYSTTQVLLQKRDNQQQGQAFKVAMTCYKELILQLATH